MISLTPSHLIQHMYCPRFTYFEWVLRLPQYEERSNKVLCGRHLHNERLERNKGCLRRHLGVVERYNDQYLTNELLRGRVDEVLHFDDGTSAPLDYKFAAFKGQVYRTYRIQMYCYAWLIETTFARPVTRGFLVYTRSNNRVETVPVLTADIDRVKSVADEIREVVEKNYFPKATSTKSRCVDCTYRNVCIR